MSLQDSVLTTSLGLVGDGDDMDLLLSIESSFNVTFGDETANWKTVGDVYRSLLALTPTATEDGRCLTMMAFHRVRNELARMGGSTPRMRPSTRLVEIVPMSPKRALRQLSVSLGITSPAVTLSLQSVIGFWCVILGFLSNFASFAFSPLWPLTTLMLTGIIMMWTDPGSFGNMTVADLSRSVANRNFAYFAARGADRRPKQLWKALCRLVSEECDVDPAFVFEDTRFFD